MYYSTFTFEYSIYFLIILKNMGKYVKKMRLIFFFFFFFCVNKKKKKKKKRVRHRITTIAITIHFSLTYF